MVWEALASWESHRQTPGTHAASVRHGYQQRSRVTVWLQSVRMMAVACPQEVTLDRYHLIMATARTAADLPGLMTDDGRVGGAYV